MIKEEQIEITLTSNVIEWYIEKGYEVPSKARVKMEVSSNDLPPSSGSYITRICDECGEEHFMKRVKYTPVCRKCNSGKMSKERADVSLTVCPDCGCKISYSAKRCKECAGKANSGENNPMYGRKLPDTHPLVLRNKAISEDPTLHPLYKDGSTIDTRMSGKFQVWAKAVKELYSNKCDCCGYDREVALKAHHLYAYEKYASQGLDIDNGVALCANCHEEFHKQYGYGDNTPEQYLNYKEARNG